MIIKARIKTNQKKFSVIKGNEKWTIYVKATPEKNMANLEIVRELSKTYGNARILRGLKSREKVIEIRKSGE